MSHETARSRAQRQAFQKGLWPPKLTAAQVQLQTRSWEEQSRRQRTLRCLHGAPGPILAHGVTASGRFPFPAPSPEHYTEGGSYHPVRTLRPPHTYGGNKEHGTPWFRKKTGNRKRGWFGPHLPGQVSPRPPLPPSAPVPSESPLRQCFSLLLLMAHQPRFHVGARRFGWEGVGDRGLRCQRPPPLEVGRERIHLCCLLFVCTCLAICLSLSCSPATGRLRVLGSRRLQLYARCHLEGAWL